MKERKPTWRWFGWFRKRERVTPSEMLEAEADRLNKISDLSPEAHDLMNRLEWAHRISARFLRVREEGDTRCKQHIDE